MVFSAATSSPNFASRRGNTSKEAPRVAFQLERADKIVGIPAKVRAAFAMRFHCLIEPHIRGIMQIHVGGDGRNNPAPQCPRCRVRHLSVGIQYPCFQPAPDEFGSGLSSMRNISIFSSLAWSMLSKKPLISASTT